MAQPNYRNASGTQYPQLCTSHDGTYQVGVMAKTNWHGLLFKKVFSTGVTTTFDLETAGAPVSTSGITPLLSDALGGDGHYAYCGMLDDQGRYHLVGNSLDTTPHYLRSAANDLTTWTNLTWPFPGFDGSTGDDKATYNIFNRLSDGRVLWWMAERQASGDPKGLHYLGHILPLGSSTWVPLVDVGVFCDSPTTGTPERIYMAGAHVEYRAAGDRVWCWGILRNTWTDTTTQAHPYLIYSDNVTDKTSWKAVDGTSVPMPLQATGVAGSAWEIPLTHGTYSPYQSGQLVIDNGHPHVILAEGGTSNSWHTWHNGTSWQSEQCATSTAAPSPIGTRFGVMMAKRFGAPGRMQINSILAGGPATIQQGDLIPGGYDIAFADPIQMQRHRIVDMLVPDGDTPRVWRFGERLRLHP